MLNALGTLPVPPAPQPHPGENVCPIQFTVEGRIIVSPPCPDYATLCQFPNLSESHISHLQNRKQSFLPSWQGDHCLNGMPIKRLLLELNDGVRDEKRGVLIQFSVILFLLCLQFTVASKLQLHLQSNKVDLPQERFCLVWIFLFSNHNCLPPFTGKAGRTFLGSLGN